MKQSTFISSAILLQLVGALCSAQNSSTTQERPTEIPRESLPNAYCGQEDPVPASPHVRCSLCEGRCGRLKTNVEFCSCHPVCVVYGDCCEDFEQTCPIQYAESSSLRSLFKYRKTECNILRFLHDGFYYEERFNFIAICGHNGNVCDKTKPDNILQPNLAIPITDHKTGFHYVNYECARCNNVTDAIFWIPHIFCDPRNLPQENVTSDEITQELLEMYLPLCSVTYIIPEGITPRRCCNHSPITQCPSSCNNTKLIEKCEDSLTVDFIATYSSPRTKYRNYYCALCAGHIQNELRCAPYGCVLSGAKPDPGAFSLSVLFDFDPSEGVTVGRKACSSGQTWIASIGECRQISCPEDTRLVDGSCLSLSLQFELMASLRSNKTHDVDNIKMHLELGEFDIKSINKQMSPFLVEGTMDIGLNKTRVSNYVLNITLEFHLMFNRNSTFNFKSDLHNFIDNASTLFNSEVVLLLQRSGVNLGDVVVLFDDNIVFKQEFLSDCTWYRFYEDEFELRNNTLLLKASQMIYASNRFSLLHSDALVCVSNSDQDMNRLNLDVSPVLGILTIILISLSIICLTIRLVLQFKVKYFWSFAGKLQFNLFLSLWLAFVLLLLGGVVSIYGPKDLCVVLGTLMYWFFLAAFCWMTAVTVDTWMAFRPSAAFIKATNTHRPMAVYVLPCWLIPAALAIIVTTLDYVTSDSPYKPLIGQRLCWFNSRHALLVYFGVPVAVLTLLTTVFFIMTVVHVRRTLKSTVKTTSEKTSHQIWIYLKLFSLIGVSWVFGFVAAFVGHDALWIIFIILNASQGILVFVSFVLNQHVLRMWRTGSSTVTTTRTELSVSTPTPTTPI